MIVSVAFNRRSLIGTVLALQFARADIDNVKLGQDWSFDPKENGDQKGKQFLYM